MPIDYKDIGQLSQKASVAGTEKIEVSDTEYITPSQIAGLVSVSGKADKVSSATNGDFAGLDSNGNLTDSGKKDSDFVHTSGNETIGGEKTFSDEVNLDGGVIMNGGTFDQAEAQGFGWIIDSEGDSVQDYLDAKQDTLVSGTNIKTINNESILGSGNITVGGGGDTSSCVHKTGDETVGGDKTFTDDIIVGDASNIKYSGGGGGGGGFTRGTGYKVLGSQANSITFTGLLGEPKAFILVLSLYVTDTDSATVFGVVGDSTGCHGVYTTGTQHNYSASFTKSYSSGSFTVTAPTGINFMAAEFTLVYYYGDGTLTFHTKSMTPGSGVTSVTFTDTPLTEMPAMYAVMLESQVNNESYRRVGLFTDSWYDWDGTEDVLNAGWSFYSQTINDVTEFFTVSYNNGLNINSGGTNAGGYFHNPGTYTLYYLMASDIGGGGGGSYNDLAEELADMASDISGLNTALSGKEATSNKVTSVSAQSTDTQYPSAKLLYDQLALKQNTITVSTSEPTAYQGNNGDIWFVVSS